jgi:hypothetical protein
MKHLWTIVLASALLTLATPPLRTAASPDVRKELLILWWNVENLFDTRDDPNTEDDEFTPQGRMHWTDRKLLLKRIRIATVLRAISADSRYHDLPDIVAFAESENRDVFSGTLNLPEIAKYQIAYHESPDPRGIDIGLAWNPRTVAFKGSRPYRVALPGGRGTRDIIVAGFSVSGHPFDLLLNHWPSRSFDAAWSEPNRIAAATVARHIVDSLRSRNPKAAIVVMGDFNDQPDNLSVQGVLGSSLDRKAVRGNRNLLYNCWNDVPHGGSYAYRGRWERIDQVLVSSALLENDGLHLEKKAFEPFLFPHMMAESGKKLYSTYEKGSYRGGYSDHLPLLLKMSISD